jgi:hypothetical protein
MSRKPVVEGTRSMVARMGMPVNASPAVLPPQLDKFIDQSTCNPLTPRGGDYEQILQVADRLQAPGVWMNDIVRKAQQSATSSAGKE